MTDVTVYPPPASSSEDRTGRKRKRLDNDEKHVAEATETTPQLSSSSSNPKYLEHVKGNHLMTQTIYKRLKEECEGLAGLMVRTCRYRQKVDAHKYAVGQSAALGCLDFAKVSGERHALAQKLTGSYF